MDKEEIVISGGQKISRKRYEELKKLRKSLRVGDYIQLALMLGMREEAARKRFYRGKEDAVLAVKAIITNRERLVREFRASQTYTKIKGTVTGKDRTVRNRNKMTEL